MRRFRLIYLAPALALIALLAWAFASPVGSSPDDDFHLASIWCANSANQSECLPGDSPSTRTVAPALLYSACYSHQPTESAACQVSHFENDTKPTLISSRGNFQGSYPPVYYAVMSIFAGSNIELSALVMRIFTIVLFVGLTTALAILLPPGRRPTLVWGWVLSTVPLGLFLLSSNNPSAWAIIGVGSSWIALLGYFETEGRRRVALGALFGLSMVIAAGSRADSALYAILGVAVVGVLTFARTRAYLLSAILPIAFSVLAAVFFLTSQQVSVVSSGLGDGTVDPTVTPPSTVLLIFKNLVEIPALLAGVFGTWGLGWFDTELPAIVAFGAVVAFVGVAFAGFATMSRRKLIALAVVAAALWLLPTYILVKGMNVVGQNVQPRYLLPLIVLFAGLAVLAIGQQRLRLSRLQLGVVGALLVVAETMAMYTNLRRYITGTDGHDWNLDANMEWWWHMPIGPMAVLACGSLAFAGLLFVLAREVTKSDATQ